MKTAFVTGATAGIGEATVRTLVKSGWRCVATGRRQERLDALVGELGADQVHAACFDVRDREAMEAAIAALPDAFAGIDLLVNNAGLARGLSPAQEASLDDWQTMIDTNVTAMVVLMRASKSRFQIRKSRLRSACTACLLSCGLCMTDS